MAKTSQIVFVCSECGTVFDNWSGKCRECGNWNTLTEEVRGIAPSKSPVRANTQSAKAIALKEASSSRDDFFRRKTNISEFDRALGGGIVQGSVSLLSGEPGIGKSTLLLQLCEALSDWKILYVSGEESAKQISQRAERLKVSGENLFLFCETDLEKVLYEAANGDYQLVLIDSVQTLCDSALSSSPGSAAQVKQCAGEIIKLTKQSGFATIMVGHVNKDGVIAGPKLLEHMVDVVLYFEGDRSQSCRIIRTIKNRYGATSEIGLFDMTDEGLTEVPDPSKRLMADSPSDVAGSSRVCLMEGTRPILAEIQALTAKSPFAAPKRLANGVDYNRMFLLLAVLEQRLGIAFHDKDVYLNVIGGLRFDETSTVLGIIAALYSSVQSIPLSGDTLFLGEVGLSGECRTIGAVEPRVREAVRLGFERIVLPYRNLTALKHKPNNVELIGVRSVYEVTTIIKGTK